MSAETEHNFVDISVWVERGKRDPLLYLERQVTEIVLASIGGSSKK